MSSIGERIAAFRIKKGLSRTELASQARLSEVAIDHMENNRRKPSLKSAMRLANIFDVSLDDLIGKDESIFTDERVVA